jgi:hypothetical protein
MMQHQEHENATHHRSNVTEAKNRLRNPKNEKMKKLRFPGESNAPQRPISSCLQESNPVVCQRSSQLTGDSTTERNGMSGKTLRG